MKVLLFLILLALITGFGLWPLAIGICVVGAILFIALRGFFAMTEAIHGIFKKTTVD